jgi:hypothetical protein
MQEFQDIYETPNSTELKLERTIMVLSSILDKKINWQNPAQEKHIQTILYNTLLEYANFKPATTKLQNRGRQIIS